MTVQQQRRRKTTEPHKLDGIVVFAGVAIATVALLAVFVPWADQTSLDTGASQEGPSVAQEQAFKQPFVPIPKVSLSLELNLPALSDRQLKYKKAALALPYCPLCFGVDKPQVQFDDNEAAVFTALLYTESGLDPYDEYGNLKYSSVGCAGVAQLCGDLLTYETQYNDEVAIWTAANYFRELIDSNAGDLEAAIRQYKGVVTDDVGWQADTVWNYIKVKGGSK